MNERARYEQRLEDLQMDLRKVKETFSSRIQFKSRPWFSFCLQVDHDRDELLQQNHLFNDQNKELETKIDEQSFTIAQLTQELNDQKTTSAQLRFLSEEAERLVQENQRQLNLKKDEIRLQEEKSNRLEKKLCKLTIEKLITRCLLIILSETS